MLSIAVTSTADDGSAGTLRAAIAAANTASSPTSIVFELGTSAETITLTQGELDLSNTSAPVTMYNGTGQGPVIISGNNGSRVFEIEQNVTANISGVSITHGLATGFRTLTGSGGGICNLGTLNLTECSISGNSAQYQGGGLYNQYGNATLLNCYFGFNHVTGPDNGKGGGGGLFNGGFYKGGTLSLTGCTITQNVAKNYGGGLFNQNGNAILTDCTVNNNQVMYDSGGGLFVGSTVNLTACTISGNSSPYRGGGLYDTGSEYSTLTDCTFYGNTAGSSSTSFGGGLAIDANAFGHAPVLTACTISGNTAHKSGGLAVNLDSTVPLFDTIVAGNLDNSNSVSDIGGFIFEGSVSGNSNLIGTGGSGGLNPATNQINVPVAQLGLAPLGFYGGPTQTVALKFGSAAIGKGSVQSGVDQRGFPRPQGTSSDVGAFQSNPLVINTPIDYTNESPLGVLGVRQAVSVANAFSGNATISFDPKVFNTAQTISLNGDALALADPSGVEAITTTGLTASVTIKATRGTRVFVVNPDAVASISGLTITGGDFFRGGGVFNAGNLTLTDCTVTGNRSFFASSKYPGNGGGVSNYGIANLTNCTISGNMAATYGGGVFNNGTLSLSSCTISNNSSGANGGGGLWSAGSSAKLINTIVAGNTDVSKAADDIQGGVAVSGFFNLTGTGGSGGLKTSGFNLLGIANPGLAPLGSYGGPTQTMALLPGSPAIDKGGVVDSRGFPHPVSGLDIGAFQDRGFTVTVITGSSPQTTTVNTAFAHPLAVIVHSPFGDPVAGGVITYTVPSSGPSAILQSFTATIGSNGRASVTATANGLVGSYAVTAGASGIATAATFNLTNAPPAATQLVIHTQPSSTATAGLPFGTQPVVYVEDQSGNLETGDNTTVVTVSSLPAGSGPLEGTTSVTVKGGIATFTDLADDTAETIMLNFTSDPLLTPATSNSIVVSAAAAGHLAIHVQPSSAATAGSPFATQPVVYVEDQFGNLETGDNTTVVTATSLPAGSGPLQGTTSVTVSGGVATFTNLADNKAETITLRFTSVPALTPAHSTGIVVSPAAASQLVIHTEPSATATAGASFPTQPVIYLLDRFGNLETGDNSTQVTASLRVGRGPLLGATTITVSGGIATFTDLQDNQAEQIILVFTARGLAKAQSTPIDVSASAAGSLRIAAPTKARAETPFTITVTAYDAYNHVATGYRGTIHFSSSDSRAFLPRNYTFTSADQGVHTFGDGVTLVTGGMQTITALDVSQPFSIRGNASVLVGGAQPAVLAQGLGSAIGTSGDQLRKTMPATESTSLSPKAASPTSMQASATVPGRASVIAQADLARDRMLAESSGGLNAYLIAEDLFGGPAPLD